MNRTDQRPAIILGAGGHGAVIRDILLAGQRRVLGFLDDNPALHVKKVLDTPILGGTGLAPQLAREEGAELVVGIGDNLIRGRLVRMLQEWGVPLTCAVHPSAVIAADVIMEQGVVVMPGAVVNTRSRLGLASVVNTKASVDHDCTLGELSHVAPGAVLNGGVVVERYAVVGAGAVVLEFKRIGENAFVGAGAVVLEDVPSNAVVVGVPAKVIKYREPLPSTF